MESRVRNLVIVAAVLVALTSCARVVRVYAGRGFDAGNLRGTFVFRASGFDNNETAFIHNGEIGTLGLLTFDGAGHVSGSLNFTTADSGGDQTTCSSTLDRANSSSTLNSNGTGTLTLAFPSSTNCVLANSSGGSLVFNFVIEREEEDDRSFSVLLTSFPAGTSIAGEPINTLILEGIGTARERER